MFNREGRKGIAKFAKGKWDLKVKGRQDFRKGYSVSVKL